MRSTESELEGLLLRGVCDARGLSQFVRLLCVRLFAVSVWIDACVGRCGVAKLLLAYINSLFLIVPRLHVSTSRLHCLWSSIDTFPHTKFVYVELSKAD